MILLNYFGVLIEKISHLLCTINAQTFRQIQCSNNVGCSIRTKVKRADLMLCCYNYLHTRENDISNLMFSKTNNEFPVAIPSATGAILYACVRNQITLILQKDNASHCCHPNTYSVHIIQYIYQFPQSTGCQLTIYII